jgi:hypothetical protein
VKNNLIILSILFITCTEIFAQSQGGFEQYYYVKGRDTLTMVPLVHFQSHDNWYVEGRFNYEDMKTVSIYGGKLFSKEKGKLSYGIIPMVGVVAGKYKGGSVGFNMNVERGKLYFSSQTQFTFSIRNGSDNFFYSWSEVGAQPLDWFYAGVALQQTDFKAGTELGGVLGITMGKWTLPLYVFSPLNERRYFVLGIIGSFGFGKKNPFNVNHKKKNLNTIKI